MISNLFLTGVFSDTPVKKSKYDFLFYGGQYVNSDLLPISLYGDIAYKRSFLGVMGVNRPLDIKIAFLRFEVEGLVGKHVGVMNHIEVDGLFVTRVPNLFSLPMSFAIGEGLSWTSQNPILENVKKGFDRGAFSVYDIESRALLNFLFVEFDYGFPNTDYYPRIFVRIHHRSGIWGTYCPPDPPCGSNFLTYGIKLSL
ncbi:MAG: hypothetical protein KBA66_15740 [Leptospiraceae bacterium]|nr:hypothetical protein [Leptospiraceae bacterium]